MDLAVEDEDRIKLMHFGEVSLLRDLLTNDRVTLEGELRWTLHFDDGSFLRLVRAGWRRDGQPLGDAEWSRDSGR